MKIIAVMCLIIPLLFSPLAAEEKKPSIRKVSGIHCLLLTDAMNRAIERQVPRFAPLEDADFLPVIIKKYPYSDKGAPFAVIGDFNGDSFPDLAALGQTNMESMLLVLLSTSSIDFRAHILERGERQNYIPGGTKSAQGW